MTPGGTVCTAWRFLDAGSGSAMFHMDLDQAIVRGVGEGISPPTFRCWSWARPAITLGCHQKSATVLDLGRCEAAGIEVAVRPSGGAAVYHDRDLGFSLVCPSDDPVFGGDVRQSRTAMGMLLVRALAHMGIVCDTAPAETAPHTAFALPCFAMPAGDEPTVRGRKIAGFSQRRTHGVFHSAAVTSPSRAHVFQQRRTRSVLPSDAITDSALARILSQRCTRGVLLCQGSVLLGPGRERLADFLAGMGDPRETADLLHRRGIDAQEALGTAVQPETVTAALQAALDELLGGRCAPDGPTAAERVAMAAFGR